MTGGRVDKQIFQFFDSVKSPVTSAGTSDSFFNIGYSSMTLEVSGTGSIAGRVEACMNILNSDGTAKTDAQCTWTTLGILNLTSFAMGTSFSANGVYAFAIDGLARVRVVLTSVSGSATVVGTAEV